MHVNIYDSKNDAGWVRGYTETLVLYILVLPFTVFPLRFNHNFSVIGSAFCTTGIMNNEYTMSEIISVFSHDCLK
jgi:hypothetical protein